VSAATRARASRPRVIRDRAAARTKAPKAPEALRAVPPVAWLVALFLTSALVYAIIGTQHVLQDLVPDELQYVKLSQNFARGAGLTFRGVGVGYPPLLPVLISWVWQFGSAVEGWQIAKVLGAVLASTVVFPVWLIGRQLVGPRLALVPAALSVTGAWMGMTALIVSENVAYPLAVASLACTVMAVRDTRARWVLASVAFAVPAVLARTQLAVLPVILVLALILDLARQPRGARLARVQARPRWLWALLVAGVVVGLIVYAADQSLTGYPLLSYPVTFAQALGAGGRQAISAIYMVAFVPVIAAAALMARGANWRDDAVGPVLVTLTAAIVVLLPVLGIYEAAVSHHPVDRYVIYLAPLFFLALVLAPGRIGMRSAVAVAAGVVVVAVWTPLTSDQLQVPGLLGTQKRLDALGLTHGDLRFVAVALLVAGAGAVALTWRSRGRGLAAAIALVAAVMVTQSWTSQALEINLLRAARSNVAPHPLDWVDRHVHGTVGELNLALPQTLILRNVYTDFYNKQVDRMYAAVPSYHGCPISIAGDGTLVQGGGPTCAPWPRYLVVQRTRVIPTFAGQQVLATQPFQGTLVQIPPGPPHLVGVVQPDCQGAFCLGVLGITTFLRAPGTIAITFGAAPGPHTVAVAGGPRWTLPGGRATTLRLSLRVGSTKLVMPVSWTSAQGAPALSSVVLESGGTATRLY
jgi:hypothetical protein